MSSSGADSTASRFTLLLIVFGLVGALTLNVVSLALPSWLHFSVDTVAAGTNASSGLDYYSRSRGAFLTCLTDTSAALLQANPGQVRYRTCLDNDLGGNVDSSGVGYVGWQAGTLLILRRLHIGLHLACGLCLCFAVLVFLACVVLQALRNLFIASAFCLLAAGLQFGSLIVFGQGLFLELLPPVDGTRASANIYNAMPQQLQLATRLSTGPAYFVALAAFVACLAAAAASTACAVASSGAAAKESDAGGDSFSPSGHTRKANGGRQAETRMDNLSNISAQSSNRLRRIPVQAHQNYAFESTARY